jgi:hypothetical protein
MGMNDEPMVNERSGRELPLSRRWLQLQLISLLMLLAVVAIWVQWLSMRRQIRWLEKEVPQLQQLCETLVPVDSHQCYLFKTPGSFEDESSWQIHIPKGQKRTLTMGGQWKYLDRFPKDCSDAATVRLGEGTHRISLSRMTSTAECRWMVRLNGNQVFEKKISITNGEPGWIGYEPELSEPITLSERVGKRFFHREIKDPNPTVTAVPSQIATEGSVDAQGVILLLSEAQ